jgi:hypothetical protein
MRFLIGLLVTLLAISIAYPAALLVLAIPIVVLISVARERIKYQVAHRYPAHRHPATRAREYAQFKTEQRARAAIRSQESTARVYRTAHETDLDVSNPTSVIRQRRESGELYVPLGTCECEAYPRPHQHAGTAAERAVAAQSRTTVKPCTEGGPCRAADREIIYDGLGNRAASRCNRCERERYWLPYITGK